MRILNLGILAHVDAGKTTLTDQLLYHAGIIEAPGSVDHGTTQTDTLDLERERGITIQSAVVSFQIGDLKVNLIDTPGHPDFIAEVERALRVLDGVVLVVSAVEGVQSQTRRMAAAIRALGLPCIVFINKIDRAGARADELLDDIRIKLEFEPIAISQAHDLGSRDATSHPLDADDGAFVETLTDVLSTRDDSLLEAYERANGIIDSAILQASFKRLARSGVVTPVAIGAAARGVGINQLLAAIERFLPPSEGEPDEPLDGVVFKVRRDWRGERIVYARLFSGSIAARETIPLERVNADGGLEFYESRIVAIDAFDTGAIVAVESASAGEIVLLHGLSKTRIGDNLGNGLRRAQIAGFALPVLESLVEPREPSQRTEFNAALEQLADYDPLITLRRDRNRGDISVRLYGEVQKEVIGDTLSRDYGIPVVFQPSRIVCVEQVTGVGTSVERMGSSTNPFVATIGLRVEPGTPGRGLHYERELGSLPRAFYTAIKETIRATLLEGPHGWEVIDPKVSLTHAGFDSVSSTAGDFRNLTPLVLMDALMMAGVQVCEPLERFKLDVPEDLLAEAISAVGAVRGAVMASAPHGPAWRVEGTIPTAEVQVFEQRLPGLTQGEGDFQSQFDSWAPMGGEPPTRSRTDFDPTNRDMYLARVRGMPAV